MKAQLLGSTGLSSAGVSCERSSGSENSPSPGAKQTKAVICGQTLRMAATKQSLKNQNIVESPAARWRVLNHWDVFSGGRAPVASDAAGLVARPRRYSIFYQGDDIMSDELVRDYCRALASVGIAANAMATNMPMTRFFRAGGMMMARNIP